MSDLSVQRQFTAALDALLAEVRRDRSILAALLGGSLSHDTVWARSDIDLVLVTIDDRQVPESNLALDADGVNVHALLMPRAEFRRFVEGSLRNSFMHSFLAKAQLLYTHDPSIEQLCERLKGVGSRDAQVQLLHAGAGALPCLYKAHKWLQTRGDLDYTALWILYAATPLAQIEVISAGMLVDREVLPNAAKLNPRFFATVYSGLLNQPKTRPRVQAALDAADEYIASRAASLFAPVIEYLKETGEARSCSELEQHFHRNFGVSGVTVACEYLSDQGLIGKVSVPVHLTKRSNVEVQELAFVYLSEPPDVF